MTKIYSIAAAFLLFNNANALLISSSGRGSRSPRQQNLIANPAFTTINNNNSFSSSSSLTRTASQPAGTPTDNDGNLAQAFQDYMTKSHDEKIRAVQVAEEKKNAEIQALQQQIAAMNSGGSITTTTQPSASTDKELAAKVEQYQKFISQYVVNAQEEKYKAVKAAEAAIEAKYQEKLNAFMLNPAPPSVETKKTAITTPVANGVNIGSKIYQDRNANVAAAAKAGKSRWGDAEVQKVSSTTTGSVAKSAPTKTVASKPSTPATKTASTEVLSVPAEVIAADHGLRADGGVGGLTLAERVAQGADASMNGAVAPTKSSKTVSSSDIKVNPAYEARNAYITAATKAGKQHRWGEMEVQKAVEFHANRAIGPTNSYLDNLSALSNVAAETIVVSAEVEAADHGLRADGGVGGPSLAERVNLGARLLQQA